ncbi:hypothetical protein A3B18_02800 [Candidatus Giovannonibacteria bacterium RIFCSPLOWO2_01_FULL_46_13]|uniref:Uncharacterized protein n=1 Tax=Candidatus Giovannonibacteria bacterium RIFCSPLOWO2_01_FULL_46_13 TaxID=1798352 RepID=A0A1F5X314_9BACT|nr:MAG: hypothetical protein A3B18_02800 [Candidatus Giovannonibacteria bacterium RIFCSPLOWO2_01_FULL_46_13]
MQNNSNLFGFRLIKFLELGDWKALEFDGAISLQENVSCPGDGNKLRTVVTLVSGDGGQKIRLGVCESCGYFGYMDRPTREWIENFYTSVWREGEEAPADILSKDKKRKKEMMAFLKKFPIDKSRPVLEIGSGYGGAIAQLKKLGFKNIFGLENSKHRAEAVRKAHGVTVFENPFEKEVQEGETKKYAPFGLIVSHHVLEHTYEPLRIIELAASIQNSGDFLALSVPNSSEEFSMGQIFFLPHLHSFTPQALEKILNKAGYSLVDNSFTTEGNISFLAQKNALPSPRYTSRDYFKEKIEKFNNSLGLGVRYNSSPRELWWDRKAEVAGQGKSQVRRAIKYVKAIGLRRSLFKKRMVQRAVVADLEKRFTNPEDSPIEIQFEGNIKLTYK